MSSLLIVLVCSGWHNDPGIIASAVTELEKQVSNLTTELPNCLLRLPIRNRYTDSIGACEQVSGIKGCVLDAVRS